MSDVLMGLFFLPFVILVWSGAWFILYMLWKTIRKELGK
jgi:hypothetical protein